MLSDIRCAITRTRSLVCNAYVANVQLLTTTTLWSGMVSAAVLCVVVTAGAWATVTGPFLLGGKLTSASNPHL